MVNEQQIKQALKNIPDPVAGTDIITANRVAGMMIKGKNVQITIEVPPEIGASAEPMRQQVEKTIRNLKDVENVTAILTAHTPPPKFEKSRPQKQPVPGVKKIIAVASGKGGVGKSTIAINLAVALSQAGHRTAIMDADIHGPSLPKLMNIHQKPEILPEKKAKPLIKENIQLMSIGFLIDQKDALVWRGPMVGGAVKQLIYDTAWDDVDILIIDMPPGTGDAQLTLAQNVPVDGAVIVSTPQDLALIDAKRGIEMFKKTNVLIVGLIENMTHFNCENCGHENHIFGNGGAQTTAKELNIPFLGAVPLTINLRTASDTGTPIAFTNPNAPEAKIFAQLAAQIS